MIQRDPKALTIPAYVDSAFVAEVTTEFIAKEASKALEAWDELNIDNYVSITVRGKDPNGNQRLGFMVTSWEDLLPGDTITVMGKVLVVQKENP